MIRTVIAPAGGGRPDVAESRRWVQSGELEQNSHQEALRLLSDEMCVEILAFRLINFGLRYRRWAGGVFCLWHPTILAKGAEVDFYPKDGLSGCTGEASFSASHRRLDRGGEQF